MPVEPEKDEGPATTIGFLGLELNSVALEVRLPIDKLRQLKALIVSWRGKKACRKRDLLSLICFLAERWGLAEHNVRWLNGLSTITDHLDQFVRLNREARADFNFRVVASSGFRSVASLPQRLEWMFASPNQEPDATMTSDAPWHLGLWDLRR